MIRRELEFTSLYTRAGEFERNLRFERWPKPSGIEVKGANLRYRFIWEDGKREKLGERNRDLLQEFIGLADTPTKEFAGAVNGYARKWGVLELCAAHEIPASHQRLYRLPIMVDGERDLSCGEPSANTSELAERDRALLAEAQADQSMEFDYRQGTPPQLEGKRPGANSPRPIHPLNRSPHPTLGESFDDVCPIRKTRDGIYSEPLSAWRFWATQARSLLSIAALAARGQEAERSEWLSPALPLRPAEAKEFQILLTASVLNVRDRKKFEMLFDMLETTLPEPWPWKGGHPLKLISAWRNRWLGLANIALTSSVEEDHLTMTFAPARDSGWLFATLATQLTFIIQKAEAILICTNCGIPYVPKQRPRYGTHTYCAKCGTKAAWRDAQLRHRHPERLHK